MSARLGSGWSMHTTETGALTRSTQLTFEEQEHIMHVIRQAELLEHTEMQRVGSEAFSFYFILNTYVIQYAFSALTLLVGYQEEHPACKN